jgi:Tol biopolymer transport system component
MRCLEKRASRRFQSAHDLAFALRHCLIVQMTRATAPSSRWRLAAVAGLAGAAAATAGFSWWSSASVAPANAEVRQLTFDSGVEAFPNLSRDGTLIVYTGTATRNRDIFLRDIKGRDAINLTEGSPANDSEPALSPDGQQIAFRSDRDGGGIFVVGRTGGVARRVSRSGFNPSWSPDGSLIVTGTEAVDWRPESRSANESQLEIHDVAGGRARTLSTGDAVQPAWSPGGHRIAYWGLWERNQRDIWTVAVNGSEPVRVTDDDAIDWDPHWSADGRWLYFSSDRGGTMNLWRVAIDEQSGAVQGPPEPLTLPSAWIGHARMGQRGEIVYGSFQRVSNLDRVPFDPVSGTFAGSAVPITTGSNYFSNPQPSKDGRLLAFIGQNGVGRNVFVSSTDGRNIRPLTGGPYRETGLNWGPDDRVAFFSSRSGLYQVFEVRADGSAVRQLTKIGGYGVGGPIWSHDGSHIAAYEPVTARSFLVDVTGSLPVTQVVDLPRLPDGRSFTPFAWSFDNSRLVGQLSGGGIAVLRLSDKAYQVLTTTGAGGPRWLPDGRRIIYSVGDAFYLVDEQTGRVTSIGSPDDEQDDLQQARPTMTWSLAWDGRWIYRARFTIQSDLWLLNTQAQP